MPQPGRWKPETGPAEQPKKKRPGCMTWALAGVVAVVVAIIIIAIINIANSPGQLEDAEIDQMQASLTEREDLMYYCQPEVFAPECMAAAESLADAGRRIRDRMDEENIEHEELEGILVGWSNFDMCSFDDAQTGELCRGWIPTESEVERAQELLDELRTP